MTSHTSDTNHILTRNQIKTYLRKNSAQDKPSKIQIIYTRDTPLQAIIGFHQTVVMNIISRDFAYSLFPDLNFIKRGAYDINYVNDTHERTTDDEDPKAKYTRRGWKCEQFVEKGDTKNTRSLTGARKIGDSYTWTMALDTSGVDEGQPSSILQHSFFRVGKLISSRDSNPTRYYISRSVIKSCVLRYKYTILNKRKNPSSFWVQAQRKIDTLTESQLSKYHWVEKKPSIYYRIPVSYENCRDLANDRIKLAETMAGQEPEGWMFYDDQIPTWYEQYLKEGRVT